MSSIPMEPRKIPIGLYEKANEAAKIAEWKRRLAVLTTDAGSGR